MNEKFTNKAQNALNSALEYAREMGHSYIGSEHLLLGLLSETDSIASKVLTGRVSNVKVEFDGYCVDCYRELLNN